LSDKYLKRGWIWIGRRVGTWYLLTFLVSLLFIDYVQLRDHVRAKTLSRLMPESFDYLIDFAQNKRELDQEKLQQYEYYYEKVVDFIPIYRGDAYEILGFCHYHLGEYRESLMDYIKASRINPHFFWPHYNLGVIYFKRGYYSKASSAFETALATKLEDNFDVINTSKLFNPILMSSHPFTSATMLRLKTAYRDSHVLLILSYYYLNDFPKMFQQASSAIAASLDEDGRFYYYAGLAAYHMKRYKEAVYFFQTYTGMNTDFANAFYYLGISLKALGNEELSAKALGRAKLLRLTDRSEILMAGDVNLQMF